MSTKTIQEELNEVIAKNLPAQVGETLKLRLEQAEKDVKTIETLKDKLDNRDVTISDLNRRIEEYIKFDQRNLELEVREKAVAKKEIEAEVEALKVQLAAEKEKSDFAFKTSLGLVRNIEYRKNIFDTENPGGVGVVDGHGNWHYPSPSSKHYNETQTNE